LLAGIIQINFYGRIILSEKAATSWS